MLLQEMLLLYMYILRLFRVLLNPVFLIPIGVLLLVYIKKNKDYKATTYYQITQVAYLKMLFDKGRYGEYLTYKNLRKYEDDGAKFLFNVYIPKEKGETTEIDVLMIHKKGILVFESKNYSGWIFGSENQRNWYQTLPAGRGKSHKESFYNPIMQNRSHIKHLQALLGEQQIPMFSIIVFSERCTLKRIEISSEDIHVIKRNKVAATVAGIFKRMETDRFTDKDVANFYHTLYPYTQVSDEKKAQHISDIQNKFSKSKVRKPVKSVKVQEVQTKNADGNTTSQNVKSTNVQEIQSQMKESESTVIADRNISVKPMLNEISDQKCPRCGGNLVLRTASKGNNAGKQFWGCAQYPKCRYIRNL